MLPVTSVCGQPGVHRDDGSGVEGSVAGGETQLPNSSLMADLSLPSRRAISKMMMFLSI